MSDKKWFNIISENKDNNITIYINDVIGGFGLRSKDFIDNIILKNAKDITVRINSPGGNVFDALGIYHFLRNSNFKVTTIIEGLAASAATIIALAGSKIIMAENSLFMIHDPFMNLMLFMQANSEQMRELSDELEKDANFLGKVKEQLVNIYSDKSGKDKQTINKLMTEETWMDAQEAKKNGFIDEISNSIKIAAHIDIDNLCFNNIPQDKIKILNDITKKTNDMNLIAEINGKFDEFKNLINNKIDNLFNKKEDGKVLEYKLLDDKDIKEKIQEFKKIKDLMNEQIKSKDEQIKSKDDEILRLTGKGLNIIPKQDPYVNSENNKSINLFDFLANKYNKLHN